jgi:hypothetical protein
LDFLSRLLTVYQSGTESIQFVVQRDELIHKIVFHLALGHIVKPQVIGCMIDLIRLENTWLAAIREELGESLLGRRPRLGGNEWLPTGEG